MFKKEMIIETRYTDKDNLRVLDLVRMYADEVIYVDCTGNYYVTIKCIMRKSKIKDFKANLELINNLGINGRIVE